MRFLYLQRNAFGGRVVGRGLGVRYAQPSRFRLSTLEPLLQDVHDRLDGVLIEQLAYAEFIRRYDRAGALFYIDPPYLGTEHVYGEGLFSEGDFAALSALLRGLKGRFVLSINDALAIRELFAGFAVEEASLHYRLSGGVTPAKELIISGGGDAS